MSLLTACAADCKKKIKELEAIAYRGSSNTSLVSRLRDDVEALQKKLSTIKTGAALSFHLV